MYLTTALNAHVVNKPADHVSNMDKGNTGSANKPSGLFIKSADRPLVQREGTVIKATVHNFFLHLKRSVVYEF